MILSIEKDHMIPFGVHMVLIARFRFKGCGTAQGQNDAWADTLTMNYFESLNVNIITGLDVKG